MGQARERISNQDGRLYPTLEGGAVQARHAPHQHPAASKLIVVLFFQVQPRAQHIEITRGGHTLVVSLVPNAVHPVQGRIDGRLAWIGSPRKWRPWKLETFRIAGKTGFIVGLYRIVRFFPEPVHTLYVYGFDGLTVYPKWRGSFLGRDFSDFEVVGKGPTQYLAVLEKGLKGRTDLGYYDWSGFGFAKESQVGDWPFAHLRLDHDLIEVLSPSGRVLYRGREESATK